MLSIVCATYPAGFETHSIGKGHLGCESLSSLHAVPDANLTPLRYVLC